MSLSRATANGFTDARPVTSRSSSTYSNNNNGGSPGFFERHNPFLSRGNRPRTSTADSSYGGNALDQPEPSSPRRRSGLRPGLGRFSSSASQLPLDSNGRAPFPTSPSRPDSRAAAAAGASTEELVSPTEPSMHSMARTNSGNGLSGGGSSSRDREGGSALGRMFRRYSQGQHGIPRTTSSSGIDSQAAATRTAVTGATAQPTSSSLPPNARSNSSSRDVSTAAGAPAANGDSAGIENLPGAIAAAQGLPLDAAPSSPAPGASTTSAAAAPAGTNPSPQAGVHRIRLVPHLEATRSLHFEPIERDLREGTVAVKIGRFTDRTPAAAPTEDAQGGTLNNNTSTAAAATTAGAVSSNQPLGAGPGNRGGAVPSSAGGGGRIDSSRIAFKSKVVSRGHAELWCEPGGRFFIKDTKSSSGTFLNHIRLSAPNVESRPFPVKDGDILQLGVDYQGGTEEIYRCVKIRVELNRGWQREANQFNVNALRQLRALQGSPLPAATAPAAQSKASPSDAAGVVAAAAAASGSSLPTNRQTMNVTDCCICLFSVTVCQALFIAPCSHVFHYKCIRPLLNLHHPGFSCPLCRTFADLEADVEQDEEWQEALLKEAEAAEMAREGGGSGAAAGEPATPAVDRHVDGPPPMVAAASSSQGHGSNGSSHGAAPRTVSPAGAELATSPNASGLPNTPSIPSGLRQQLQLDRPITAVGDDTTGVLDQTAVMGMGGAQQDEEMQEVMQDAIGGDESEVSAAATHGSSGGRLASTSPRHSTIDEESLEAANASANRSLDPSTDNDATLFTGQRRGSQPINIRSSSGASSSGTGGDVSLSGFSPLEEARTPVNQHVLSVLAEAPPPRSMAARRFAAAQNGEAGAAGAATSSAGGGGGMPSLGASSSLLSVPPQAGTSSSSTSPPTNNNNNNNLDSRRGSAVSEDVGFQTPGEGNSVDHSHSGFATGGASNSLAFPGQQQQQQQPSSSAAAAAAGEQARTRNSGSAGSGGSSGSHQASPSTAGDVDGDGSEAEPEAVAGAEGASSSRRTPAKAKAATGDTAAAAGRRERSADSRASSTASGGAGGGSRGAAGAAGSAATTTSPRGKMKMFLKKAAGA